MFDLNWRPIVKRIGSRFKSNMYIPVYHTNGRSIKNTIGVFVNRLVGMGLYDTPTHIGEPILCSTFGFICTAANRNKTQVSRSDCSSQVTDMV